MGRGNTSWEKRQREKQKRERKEAKRARRDERRTAPDEEPSEGPSQDELMAKFAELGAKHAAGQISDAAFEDERAAIFEQLGLDA
mgnify:FL=1